MARKPVIMVVDDEAAVLETVKRDLRDQYRKEYRIMATTSASEALDTLKALRNQNEGVALLLSDQRMPEMLGVEYLDQAKELFPQAKRALLTAYSDTQAAIRAINEVQLDYYLMKPWDPPEEKLYPVINELLDEWQSSHIPEFKGLRMVGYQWSPASHTIKDFLSGNLIPYEWYDVEKSEEGQQLLEINGIDLKETPAVFFEDGSYLKRPAISEIGEQLGMTAQAKKEMYDVAIIGAGPAGLAAGVYGGSEGLNTVLIERRAPGGQAGTSSRIENYLGFPNGLSGAELSRRAISQATRFGIEFLSPQAVQKIIVNEGYKCLLLADGSELHTRSVVITAGVDYRKLAAEGIDQFTGAGVYYGAATTEANACRNEDVYIVGGGNSAGQAAMYLAKFARSVSIVIRKPDLSSSMSQYLIDQIGQTENIHVLGETEVLQAKGKERLASLLIRDNKAGEEREVNAVALLIFIGAKPATDWIDEQVLRNERGFLYTGNELRNQPNFRKYWKLKRDPLLLETSVPGVFAAGDVRAGAMNRVASAVGEGAMTIKMVHEYLGNI